MERQSSFQEDNEFASSPDESSYSSDGNVDFNAALQIIQRLARMMNHQLRNQVRRVEAICYVRFGAFSLMMIRATTSNDCPKCLLLLSCADK